MKKNLILLFSFLVGLTCFVGIQSEAEEQRANTDVLVKLIHENNGNHPTEFLIYGISENDYNKALEMKLELSVNKTKEWLKANKLSILEELTVMPSTISEVSLPRYNEQRERMYYILVQKKPDREGMNGKELYQVFPSFISFDELEEETMTIETKRVFLIQTPYFFKYSSGNQQKPLKDAEFAFYQLNESHQKEYLMSLDPIEWQVTSNSKEAWQFKSDENGLVTIPDLGLELGTYYFEETKAPKDYLISDTSREIPLVISEDDEGLKMSINGEQLVPMQAGELPEETLLEGKPRVLNELHEVPPSEVKPPNNNTTGGIKPKNESFLPKTGEIQWAFSSVGFLLLLIGFIYIKRRKENE
ncbi:SpaA isopeptide-forming pilin-related protein [Vagococcus fluvialis]|uniref:SpaA isopeptide-forming pilin-related protein n=1 Tax=Vagococcus fluvialis TaxID=2738 RepID=UPI003B5AC571